jgi:hypothetical protein
VTEQSRDRNEREWRDAKRHASCLWSCLTEPFVVVALVIASLVGAYNYGRKAERARLKQEKADREHQDD